ncbi:TetR/AcrR family transcriptional regulator [Actinomyces succiniciruminis]|uniref:TetR bacterial regulatory protein HTH signature n=1 Tax=Actinomyces succiniciruminis TaxID=1522002 RepID=A0A1L7RKT7_9ACTO|nr:TetR/AcrR family transcriptional regulator [Actinomyces succiniciruminis]CED89998.1 TetR bacterial regulatory protein HTH signature [Actinomyces succiniciruminis]
MRNTRHASDVGVPTAASALPERILTAAAELVDQHGPQKTTVAEIARAAGVGKGTAYLYWPSKEKLLLALLAHELVVWIRSVRAEVVHDPERLRLSRLAVLLLDSWRHEVVELIASDLYLRRVLAAHRGSRELLERSMPMELCVRVLPLMRREGLVRSDTDAHEQAYVFNAVMTGFVVGKVTERADSAVIDPAAVLARTIRQLLEPDTAPTISQCERLLPEVLEVVDQAVANLEEMTYGAAAPERTVRARG